jgi:glyoxylase-like metal-dependent hydrolase (beta-lactamase superfamily II)
MARQQPAAFAPVETAARNSIQFIGNATVLIRYAGLTILTDPNFIHRGQSVPLGYGLSTTRLTDPAMEIDELPPLDLVVLSHYHGDHFDSVAEERLDRSLPIVTTPEAADTLGDKGFVHTRARRPGSHTSWTRRARTCASPPCPASTRPARSPSPSPR